MSDTLFHKPDEPGYIIAWKYKYRFETGRMDEVMTYGEAKKKAEELSAQDPEKTFWPEPASEEVANRFFNPASH